MSDLVGTQNCWVFSRTGSILDLGTDNWFSYDMPRHVFLYFSVPEKSDSFKSAKISVI